MTEDKDGGIAGPPVAGGIFATILESVTQRIAGSAKGAAVSEVVAAAAREAVDRGGDLIPATKAIIMGVVRGTGATDEAALQNLSQAARVIIHHTADRNGNLAAAIKGIVLGAIAGARLMGVEIAKAASMAAKGALDGASEAGSVTVERVRGALKEPIGGIKVILPEPLSARG
jgi:hypothetical protein